MVSESNALDEHTRLSAAMDAAFDDYKRAKSERNIFAMEEAARRGASAARAFASWATALDVATADRLTNAAAELDQACTLTFPTLRTTQ